MLLYELQEVAPLHGVPVQDAQDLLVLHLPGAACAAGHDRGRPLRLHSQHHQLTKDTAIGEPADEVQIPHQHVLLLLKVLFHHLGHAHGEDEHGVALRALLDDAIARHEHAHHPIVQDLRQEFLGGVGEDGPLSQNLCDSLLLEAAHLPRVRGRHAAHQQRHHLLSFLGHLLQRPCDDAAVQHAHEADLQRLHLHASPEPAARQDAAGAQDVPTGEVPKMLQLLSALQAHMAHVHHSAAHVEGGGEELCGQKLLEVVGVDVVPGEEDPALHAGAQEVEEVPTEIQRLAKRQVPEVVGRKGFLLLELKSLQGPSLHGELLEDFFKDASVQKKHRGQFADPHRGSRSVRDAQQALLTKGRKLGQALHFVPRHQAVLYRLRHHCLCTGAVGHRDQRVRLLACIQRGQQ
mmetsp:Transcript_100499/g.239664  ORF Transcript_100499/g.239664 Transcript_100499/m.239664 type:complete len:405 (+) Transcript_100499:982-2196(+)